MSVWYRLLVLLALFAPPALAGCGPSDSGDDPQGEAGADGGPGGDGCTSAACLNQCPNGTQTRISGTVLAPNGIDPIPGAVVYIPRGELDDLQGDVSCELCSQITGSSLVSTESATDGSFQLAPIPTELNQQPGKTVQLVVQKGRFRKVVDYAIGSPCRDNVALPAETTLPKRTEGLNTIPRIAVATGSYDVMECVLLNVGLEHDAFDLYNGMKLLGGTPNTVASFDTLLADPAQLNSYHVVFINCTDNEYENLLQDATIRSNIESYVASGGRLYVTDWSYDYVEQVSEFAGIIDFGPTASGAEPEPQNDAAMGAGGITTEAVVHDSEMAEWLRAVEAVTGEEIISDTGTVHIEHFLIDWAMQLSIAMNPDVKLWLSGDVSGGGMSGELPLTTTFDYQSCGRVLYSSYHTLGRGAGLPTAAFPSYCSQDGMSPQERVLMYLIMHVADCISVD